MIVRGKFIWRHKTAATYRDVLGRLCGGEEGGVAEVADSSAFYFSCPDVSQLLLKRLCIGAS